MRRKEHTVVGGRNNFGEGDNLNDISSLSLKDMY
jgi:hypothetical protein